MIRNGQIPNKIYDSARKRSLILGNHELYMEIFYYLFGIFAVVLYRCEDTNSIFVWVCINVSLPVIRFFFVYNTRKQLSWINLIYENLVCATWFGMVFSIWILEFSFKILALRDIYLKENLSISFSVFALSFMALHILKLIIESIFTVIPFYYSICKKE